MGGVGWWGSPRAPGPQPKPVGGPVGWLACVGWRAWAGGRLGTWAGWAAGLGQGVGWGKNCFFLGKKQKKSNGRRRAQDGLLGLKNCFFPRKKAKKKQKKSNVERVVGAKIAFFCSKKQKGSGQGGGGRGEGVKVAFF